MKKILSLFFLILTFFSLSSCSFFIKPKEEPFVCTNHVDADDNGLCDICSAAYEDGSEIPEVSPSLIVEEGGDAHVEMYKGKTSDLKASALSEVFALDGAIWESECDEVASVIDGVVSANSYGRTTVKVTDANGEVCKIIVTVTVFVNQSGFSVTPISDDTVYKVYSERGANELIDKAISEHKSRVILDFSAFEDGYFPFDDFDFEYEFGNHVSIEKKYYEKKPNELYVEFKYNADAATVTTKNTPSNEYASVTNANAALRLAAAKAGDGARADDFSDFAIYKSNNGTKSVQNSEELWLALEHNYLPVFTTKYTKAEKFFEEAKMILREIITDGMTDYEKVLAIFDYLVEAVEYDYAALNSAYSSDPITNTCYYLEGVFEQGRAVCDGKSKAFVLFCRIEGIECLRDYGAPLMSDVGHAWNYVKLDGVWYLVDTTNADSPSPVSTDLGRFFGKNVEVTLYDAFLTDIFYHAEKYEYSDIHSEIFSGVTDDISATFIDAAPKGRLYDFRIGTTDELNRLLVDLFSLGVDECILSITIPRSLDFERVVGNAAFSLRVSYECEAYNVDSSAGRVCYLLLKKTA